MYTQADASRGAARVVQDESGFTTKQRTNMHYTISKEQIDILNTALIAAAASHFVSDKPKFIAAAEVLEGLLDQPDVEPVGIVVYKPKMLRIGALNREGLALPDGTRLYTHP
jgi:hypothetical protein